MTTKRENSSEASLAPVKKKLKQAGIISKNDKSLKNQIESTKQSITFEKPTTIKTHATIKCKNNNQQSSEKPNWKAVKEEKKHLKEKRKLKRLEDVYNVAKVAKKMGEKLRESNCTDEERKKLTEELFGIFKGNLKKFIFTHDISRVIQWLIKFCNSETRQLIIDELNPELSKMWQSKYAVNCIKKMLKYGNIQVKEQILKSCYGRVVSIVSHSVSTTIFNTAYKNWAQEQTKNHLKQEFYGDLYKHTKDDKIKCLNDVFTVASDMKFATLSAVKINLVRVLNKNIVSNALVQAVLLEFLSICSPEDRSELIVMLRNSIFELSKMKDGSKISMICIWHGTTKDRKLSLKSIKDHVKDIAISEYGHIVLLSIFDSIDDTVLVKKIVISELINNLKDIVTNEFGKKIILYLVTPRDTHHFHPQLIDQLKEGDGNLISKKTKEIRQKELLEAMVDPVLDSIIEDCQFWLANGSIAMVTLAILKSAHGDKLRDAFKTISHFLISSQVKLKEGAVEYNMIEHPGLHMMLKKLIQADKVLLEKHESTFGEELVKALDDENISKWIEYNRPCFLLVLLLENECETVVSDLTYKLVRISQSLERKTTPGASILLRKLK